MIIRPSRGFGAPRIGLAVVAALLLLGSWAVPGAAPAAAFGTAEPQPIPSVSAGGYMSCGVQADGTAACWGENGVPSNDTANVMPGGAATPPPGTFLEVTAGYATACGVRTDQTLVCWGSTRFNKLVVPSGTFTHVVPGLNYICAIRTDGTVTCWGGDDPAVDPDQKVIRDVPAGQFSQVTVGIRHACGLRADGSGTVQCWGQNTTRLGVNEGQTVVPPGTYRYVDVGNFTSCALRTDGTPVCWARNLNGQQTYPTDGSGNVLTFTKLSTGSSQVCGLRPDKTVVCWGRNTEGQVSPVPPGTYTQVSTGTFHSCGMREGESTAVCWGNNMSGRVQPNMSNIPPQDGYSGFPYGFRFTMNPSPIRGAGAVAGISPSPTFTLVSGSLPAGLSLSPAGLLSGTPTAAGSFPIRVAASNGLSPPDCVVPVTLAAPNDTQSMPCVPGDPTSLATATRAFTITISADAPVFGAIAGTVTSAGGGAPLAGAVITVTFSGGGPAGSATTGTDGTYRVADLVPGPYDVAATGTELQPQTTPATVRPDQTTTVDFALGPLVRPTVTSVWRNQFATVSDGLYIEWDEEINPFLGGLERAARYTVHTDESCSTAAVATGAEGFWVGTNPNRRDLVLDTVENLDEGGTYYLQVQADTELGADTGQRNARACVQFTSSLAPADRTGVSGSVTTGAGAPIAGATVTATRVVGAPGTVAGEATTDSSGAYSITGLAPGPYQLSAAASGYISEVRSVNTRDDATFTADFVLAVVASNDAYTHNGTDTALVVPAQGVLANDGGASTATLLSGPARGALTLNPDGSFRYLPEEDFIGGVSFAYTATRPTGGSSTATVSITVGAGCRGLAATIIGSRNGDVIKGTTGVDVIAGLGGNDNIQGGFGDDVICGGGNWDRLYGGVGRDHLDGGSGDDDLQGDSGNDTLLGGAGVDDVKGATGNDVLSGGAGSPDICHGGQDLDTLAVDHGCEDVRALR